MSCAKFYLSCTMFSCLVLHFSFTLLPLTRTQTSNSFCFYTVSQMHNPLLLINELVESKHVMAALNKRYLLAILILILFYFVAKVAHTIPVSHRTWLARPLYRSRRGLLGKREGGRGLVGKVGDSLLTPMDQET